MNRLTDDKTAQALKEIIDKLEAGGFEVDMSNRRYVRLAEYERTGKTPEEYEQHDIESLKRKMESYFDMQELYLPIHFIQFLEEEQDRGESDEHDQSHR